MKRICCECGVLVGHKAGPPDAVTRTYCRACYFVAWAKMEKLTGTDAANTGPLATEPQQEERMIA